MSRADTVAGLLREWSGRVGDGDHGGLPSERSGREKARREREDREFDAALERGRSRIGGRGSGAKRSGRGRVHSGPKQADGVLSEYAGALLGRHRRMHVEARGMAVQMWPPGCGGGGVWAAVWHWGGDARPMIIFDREESAQGAAERTAAYCAEAGLMPVGYY